jgi:hypothetical protein
MVDLELPGDVPVQELIPLLLVMCGSPHNISLPQSQPAVNLQIADAPTPLAPHLTLIDARVFDGAVLLLQTSQPSSILVESLAPRQFLPKSVQPGADTGGIGITWDRL